MINVFETVKEYKAFLGDCIELKKILMVFSVSSTILRSEKQLISDMIDEFREKSYNRLRQIDSFNLQHPILNISRSCLEKYFIKICNLCDIISTKRVIEMETNIEEDIQPLTSIG